MTGLRGSTVAILHYAGPPIVGGVESVMWHHANLLADAGASVRLIVGRGEAWRPDVSVDVVTLLDSLNDQVLLCKAELDRGVISDTFHSLVASIKSELRPRFENVDTIIVHNICTMAKNLPFTQALRALCAEDNSPRLVAWHHDLAWTAARYQNELHDGEPWSLLLESWDEIHMQHVAVSTMRQLEIAKLHGIAVDDIAVIPSGVQLADFYQLDELSRRCLEELELQKHYPIFLLPVRITKRKNIEYALEIIASLRERFPHAALVVTGPPGAHNTGNSGYFSELRARRAELSLEPQRSSSSAAVYFLAESINGRLPDSTIASLFRFCDALLLPSREEGFGIPVIEAGLSGMPIFCSAIPPFKEIAGELAHYFMLDSDPGSVAQHIEEVLRNDSRSQLRKRVREHYSWHAIFEERIIPLLRSKLRTSEDKVKGQSFTASKATTREAPAAEEVNS